MKLLLLAAVVAIIADACNSKSASESSKPVSDAVSEDLKGKVQQVETNTYLIDSATGKIGKLESKNVETYDDNGYTNSYSNYTAKDSTTRLYKYDHNANGYLTNMVGTKNGKPLTSLKVTVDSLGNYVSAVSYDSTGKEDEYYKEITTNKFGQITAGKGYHPDSTLKESFSNSYDSVYYVGGESKDSVGKVTYSNTVKLNDKKHTQEMDETTVTKDSTTKTHSVYGYPNWDSQGNWTQQTVAENGKPKKIVQRTITYKAQ